MSTKAVLATGNTLKVSSNGRFSLTLPANQTLKSGQQIAISDSADLKGSTAIYQVQGSAIYVNPLNSGDTVITGTGIPGHFLNITNLSTKTVLATGNTLKVSADGTFSLTLPSNQPLKSGQQLYISDSADLKGTTAIYTVNN
ncbi:Ig-like domain-containing protein [Listeria fleischmannii]|uniref:Amino acid ABC transporter periplasmic binding protein n=1 Tax=Listeria fleischmannii FSL S10-1203 TaxID=1265822 RepID=W7DHY9_9LIST|nr:Ig-like domain-containing protein [Listeria fleischmannii]EUJ50914.1 amino acid ABC transporter periplasmic binding protein [Listeria fleischmannii FSL S10-1203]